VSVEEVVGASALVVLVGEGGVGKTSTAASIALLAAERGRRVAVLTVDPAPRLGQALGLEHLDATPRQVTVPGASVTGGSLVAMRLDTRRTFDLMVRRFAPSNEVADSLLANRIYQAVAGSLGGSEHYMTFQRLFELVSEDDYDLVVVDTPPAAHVTELLGTPTKLADLIDTGAAGVLADPARILARTGSQLAKATATVVISVVERVTGITLREQVSEFMGNFASVLEGLNDRTKDINALLRSPRTAFCLTVRPHPDCVHSSHRFATALAQAGVELRGVIINRVTPECGPERTQARGERLRDSPPGTLEAVAIAEAQIDALRAIEKRAVARIMDDVVNAHEGSAPCVAKVMSLEHDVASVDDLMTIGRQLIFG
jgi:anion-transporting  ArsA/GET3 family ATPase